ncbi:hypothetical protein ACNQ2I_02935 [Mycoplasma sp. Z355B]|uniref:hypothetical protein n=1 Tax=unclassified Mycoplasma TaxID=2683645 RepID=UPI003A8B837A
MDKHLIDIDKVNLHAKKDDFKLKDEKIKTLIAEHKNNTNLHNKVHKLKRKSFNKYIISRSFFVFLNVLAIFIAASIVILNLYSIRFNKYPDTTMVYFVLIAVLSVITTLVVSLQSFFGITDKKTTLKDTISNLDEVINAISAKDDLSTEEYDKIIKLLD